MSETPEPYLTRRELWPINCADSGLTGLTDDEDCEMMGSESTKGVRMRPPVQNVYDRQVARCLSDIEQLYALPEMVEDRIKRAIEYTAKDVDKINNKESGNGYKAQGIDGNR